MDDLNGDDRFKKYMKEVKKLDLKDFAPSLEIQHTESPCQWIQTLKPENLGSGNYLDKMDDYTNQGDNYTFEKFMPYLALAFEYSLLHDFKEAKYILNQIEEMLFTMESANGCFYARIKPAMEHVLLATKTNIFILENEKPERIKSLKEKCCLLKAVFEMDPVQQAAIHALKSKFYLSCTGEYDLALTHMIEACKLDPECATWTYWRGKILRKIRRDKKELDPKEELAYFEKAVSQERDAKHLVFLAQAYQEKSNYLYKNKNSFPELAADEIIQEIDSLSKKSCDLFIFFAADHKLSETEVDIEKDMQPLQLSKDLLSGNLTHFCTVCGDGKWLGVPAIIDTRWERESVELNPSSAAISRRAGNGLMKLPKPHAKYSLAKHLLHKAETLSRNPITFHILGTFYSWCKNQEQAIKYFKKSADRNMTYGVQELIKIKYINDPNYDPLEDLLNAEKCLEFSNNFPCVEGDIGWYHMIFKNDLTKGLEYFWRIIEKDENALYLKKWYSYSFLVKGPLNMYEVLKEKILNIKEDDRNELMNIFLDKVNEKPNLLDRCEGCVSINIAQREALTYLTWKRQIEHKPQVVNNPNEQRIWNRRTEEGPRNWRRERGNSLPDRQIVNEKSSSAERAKQKQENWRLECPKF